MIDFAKLRDPEYIAKVRAESEARSRKLEEETRRIWSAVRALSDHEIEGQLSDKERRFVNSCRSLVSQQNVLTERQQDWLFSIANRYAPAWQGANVTSNEAPSEDSPEEPTGAPSP